MQIAQRLIGPTEPPSVIAEIGTNRGGDLDVARHIVTLAAKASAEIVKHQTHFVRDEMTEEAKNILPPNAVGKSIWQVMEECALSAEDEKLLKARTKDLGLIYISTPFSRAVANFLDDIGVPAFKIGSGEADHLCLSVTSQPRASRCSC